MFKRYLWEVCWLAFARLVTRGKAPENLISRCYRTVLFLQKFIHYFITTCAFVPKENSPECDLSHVLPDYREQISGTPLKYTLISTAPLARRW